MVDKFSILASHESDQAFCTHVRGEKIKKKTKALLGEQTTLLLASRVSRSPRLEKLYLSVWNNIKNNPLKIFINLFPFIFSL